MPHLTFPTSPDGLALQVLVGLNDQEMASLQNAGQPIPPPLWARGLIDTGSDVTAVGTRLIQQLGLSVFQTASTHTAGGKVSVNLYRVSLGIPGASAKSPMLNRPDLIVTELLTLLPGGTEVLVGLDVLAECLLVIDGPGKYFTLAF